MEKIDLYNIQDGDLGSQVAEGLKTNFESILDEIIKKQDALISGTNIKTINGQTVLGKGNIQIDIDLFKIVSTLPENDIDSKKIYLIQNTQSEESNIYIEYIYANGKWEKLGEYKASVDLSEYLKTADADNKYQAKGSYALKSDIPDVSNLATKTEVAEKLDADTYNTDKTTFATKAELATKVDTSAYNSDKAGFATKEELETKLNIETYNSEKANYALKSEIPTDYATEEYVQNAIKNANIEDLVMYGVEFDKSVSSPDGTRIGNMTLHKTLPIHSLMRGCLLNDDGEVIKYLNPSDWTGETRDGSQGQVMVEVPDHWWKFVTNGTKFSPQLYIMPVTGAIKVPKYYIGANEASLQRSTSKLCSVVNTSEDYRGGNNNTEWDSTYRSLLGLPATNISRTNFRTYARNRKENSTAWNICTYDIQKDLFWLFAVEYATLNTQKAYNATKTAEGYAQGGLGDGFTNLDWDKWSSYNNSNPIVPCGYTDSLGNATGEIEFTMPTEYDSTTKKLYVNRYRGIQLPFGHLWEWRDGINVQIMPGDGLSKVYTCSDPSKINDTNYDSYTYIGDEARTEGYVKEIIFGEKGEIIPSVVGGSSTTYFCDYHYTEIPEAEELRAVLFSGGANIGTSAGFVYANSRRAPSSTTAYIGSRLCFLPEKA